MRFFRYAFVALFAAIPVASFAQEARVLTETVRVIDGDTVAMGSQRIRFYGVDAPESSQVCGQGQSAWRCGAAAGDMLAREIANRPVSCAVQDTDHYGRLVAICYTDRGEDLNAFMVSQGLAVAYTQYSTRYVSQERSAKAHRYGIWDGPFERPDEYRHRQGGSQVASYQPSTSDDYGNSRYAAGVAQGESSTVTEGYQVSTMDSDERIPQDTSRATFKGMACVVLGKGCQH